MRQMRAGVTAIAVVVVGVVVVACGGGSSAPTPAATAEPTTPAATAATSSATATPSRDAIVAEVSQAYLAYWDAYADAVLHLDITRMEGFAAGAELEGIREEIEALRAEGLAARIRVEHDFEVISVTESSAVIVDEYVNNSFVVDAKTLAPETADGPGDVFKDTIRLERMEGRWVVTRGAREPAGPP
jgi:hypothetical protein